MKMKNIIAIFIGVLLAGLCGCADKFEDSDRQDDYQGYAGFWSEGGISAKDIIQNGGTEFYVEISNGNELKGYLYSQQGSTERFAEIESIICKIQDGECDYFFVDDGWGNSGTLHIQFVKDEIRIEVQDFVLGDNNASGFGISGNYVLIREKEVPVTELPGTLEQYAADWSEDKLMEEINKRKPYRDNCSYYGEVVDYMENVREVRDISIYTEPLFYTDMMFYAEEDFKEVPELILYLAKNEIYARHGYIFENEDLKNYFMAQLWYLPMTTGTEFEDAVFNECEKANLALLLKLLEESGTNNS